LDKGSDSFTFVYDGDGQRVKKTLSGGTTTYYVRGAAGETIAVYDGSGSLKVKNILSGGEAIGKIDASGNRFYYLKDHLGSIRVTVNESGSPVGYDDYYPFGKIMDGRSNNSGNSNDLYKFTGKERDTEASLNLDYFGARYYDAALGRWLSVDPMADDYPRWSPYAYSMDNPLKYIDPTGMAPIDIDILDKNDNKVAILETDQYEGEIVLPFAVGPSKENLGDNFPNTGDLLVPRINIDNKGQTPDAIGVAISGGINAGLGVNKGLEVIVPLKGESALEPTLFETTSEGYGVDIGGDASMISYEMRQSGSFSSEVFEGSSEKLSFSVHGLGTGIINSPLYSGVEKSLSVGIPYSGKYEKITSKVSDFNILANIIKTNK
jgi:RHS repeat-associated protein